MKKAVGIVVEYNPFHNGHKYHLNKAKELGDIVIGVMSGNYVQRGEPSLINRWKRAEIALREGVDIICELPCFYSSQSAEIFARGSIGILNFIGVEKIIFGSESDRLENLRKIIEISEDKNFQENLKKQLEEGISYPNAYNKILKEFLDESIEINSNDILGLEYLRAIKYFGNNIEPVALKREGGGYYSEEEKNRILSATGIRKLILEKKEIEKFVSEKSYEILENEIENNKITTLEKFYLLIRYSILEKRDRLFEIQDVEVGFDKRLYEMAIKYDNYKDFFENLITKRYTIGRVQRILIHILLDITKNDTKYLKNNIPYIRVMGFSKKGKEYLKEFQKVKENNIEIITSFKNIQKKLSPESLRFLELNEKASIIYKIINNYEERKIPLMVE